MKNYINMWMKTCFIHIFMQIFMLLCYFCFRIFMKFSSKCRTKKLGMIYTIFGSFCLFYNWDGANIRPKIRPRKILEQCRFRSSGFIRRQLIRIHTILPLNETIIIMKWYHWNEKKLLKCLYISVNSYGHVGTVTSPNQTFFPGQAWLSG